jgi:hypothetical protein
MACTGHARVDKRDDLRERGGGGAQAAYLRDDLRPALRIARLARQTGCVSLREGTHRRHEAGWGPYSCVPGVTMPRQGWFQFEPATPRQGPA